MSFLRVKHISGSCYVYEVMNVWDKNKKQSRQKVLRYVGRAVGVGKLEGNLILEVMKRDNYTCLSCGRKEHLVIDHKKSVLDGGTNVLDNLQTLCSWCNASKGRKERFGIFFPAREDRPKISTMNVFGGKEKSQRIELHYARTIGSGKRYTDLWGVTYILQATCLQASSFLGGEPSLILSRATTYLQVPLASTCS